MTAPTTMKRILVVANRTASTPQLLHEIEKRRHDASFTLVVPPRHDPDAHEDWTAEEAGELLHRSCLSDVTTMDPGADVLDTIHERVGDGDFDAIIVCMHEEHLRRLVHHDLVRRLKRLGLPTAVIPPEPGASVSEFLQSGLPGTYRDGLD
jgi:hypothetical protein